jgi:hypothetical protein
LLKIYNRNSWKAIGRVLGEGPSIDTDISMILKQALIFTFIFSRGFINMRAQAFYRTCCDTKTRKFMEALEMTCFPNVKIFGQLSYRKHNGGFTAY